MPWKEAKMITLPKPGKYPEFLKNLCPISILSTVGKPLEKAILKIVQRHTEERGKSVWSTCMSQYDIVTYEANRASDP
jgi:hypothetical protein